MTKRTEKDPNDTEALGLSRSERRALEVAEEIRRDLDRAQGERRGGTIQAALLGV